MHQSTIPALAEKPLNIEARVLSVSPELAAEWLARNPRNRNLSHAAVAQFAADMQAGRWKFTGQPIVFDGSGNLQDGQHRLAAQVKVGAVIDWLVVGGVATAAQNYMDIGRPRSVADQLRIGGYALGHHVAAAARLKLLYDGESNPTKPQIRTYAEKHHATLARSAHLGKSVSQVIGGSESAYAIAHFHMSQLDADLADGFFDRLRSGADLPATSPLLIARNYIGRGGLTVGRGHSDTLRVRFIDYLHKTWNLWVAGKRIKSFSVPPGHVTPIEPLAAA